MRGRLSLLGLVMALALVAAACGTAQAAGPPDIKYGRDVCIRCGMIVSEARFAAAYTTPEGEKLAFDDIGDLLMYQRETQDPIDTDEAWVHDYETEGWVTVEDAFFVPTLSVMTPMGHSIISFADETRATAFAADVDGEVILWGVVVDLPSVNGLIGYHHVVGGEMDHDSMDHEEMAHDEDMTNDENDHDGMSRDEMNVENNE